MKCVSMGKGNCSVIKSRTRKREGARKNEKVLALLFLLAMNKKTYSIGILAVEKIRPFISSRVDGRRVTTVVGAIGLIELEP